MLVCRRASCRNVGHSGRQYFPAAVVLFILAAASPAADLAETTRLWRTGQYAACTDSAAAAIEENPYNEQFRLWKLRAELEMGRYKDALATLDAALKQFPQSIQVRWLGINVCRFNQQPERAAKLGAEIGELYKRMSWQYSDVANQVVVGRFRLSQREDPKKVLDEVYS